MDVIEYALRLESAGSVTVLLVLLEQPGLSFKELVQETGASRNSVLAQVKEYIKLGILEKRVEGRSAHYTIADDFKSAVKQLKKFVEAVARKEEEYNKREEMYGRLAEILRIEMEIESRIMIFRDIDNFSTFFSGYKVQEDEHELREIIGDNRRWNDFISAHQKKNESLKRELEELETTVENQTEAQFLKSIRTRVESLDKLLGSLNA